MNIEASLNTNFHKAKSNKKDEFYTQLYDIEEELKHYKEHFKGKVVYCNCGVMGVPITFLDKYNPDQFELLG